MRGPGASQLLERALHRSAGNAGEQIAIARSCATQWRSATFTGARHVIDATAPAGVGLDRWLGRLAEEDLPLPGHLVADLTITAVRSTDHGRATFRLEALTVESV